VDRLHHKAFPKQSEALATILELHGTLKSALCLNCRKLHDRDEFQDALSDLNPDWKEYADLLEQTGKEPRQNPDGDVELQNRSYDTFKVPDCLSCGSGPMKPAVVFFGENISPAVKETSKRLAESASQLLIVGSSLATYSAFRIVKAVHEQGKDVCLLNVGPSRGDPLVTSGLRLETPCLPVLVAVAQRLAQRSDQPADPVLQKLLTSGIIKEVDTIGKYPASS